VVQLSATRCSSITILLVSLASSADMTLCVASQRVFVVVVVLFLYRLSPETSGYTLVRHVHNLELNSAAITVLHIFLLRSFNCIFLAMTEKFI
jgi:hypothetical protein